MNTMKRKKSYALSEHIRLTFLLAVAIAFILLLFEIFHGKGTVKYSQQNANHAFAVGEIAEGVELRQELPYSSEISGISVMFATYMRVNSGNVYISITGCQSGHLYLQTVLPASEFQDNSFVDLPFTSQLASRRDEKIELLIQSDSSVSNSITVWASDSDCVPGCALNINGTPLDKDLIYRTFVINDLFPLPSLFIILFAIILLYILILCNIDRVVAGAKYLAGALKKPGVVLFSLLFFLSCILYYLRTSVLFKSFVIPTVPLLLFFLSAIALSCFELCAEQKASVLSVAFALLVLQLYYLVPAVCASRLFYYVSVAVIWLVFPPVFLKDRVVKTFARLLHGCRKKRYLPVLVCVLCACVLAAVAEIIFSHFCDGPFLWSRYFFFLACSLAVVYLIRKRETLPNHPESFFALLALSYGLYLCVFSPLKSVSWDEQIHYERAIYATQGNAAIFTSADESIINLTAVSSNSEHDSLEIALTLDKEERTNPIQIHSEGSNGLSTVAYLPNAIGIWAGRILALPFPAVFVLGKISNLVFYLAVVYFAMRRLLRGKMIFMIIALFPTAIFLASHYSYDPWVIAFIALGTAYFLGALQRPDEKLTLREAVIIILAPLIGILPKAAYFFVVLLPLSMPEAKFSDHKHAVKFRFAVISAFAVAMVLTVYPVIYSIIRPEEASLSDLRGGSNVNGVEQIKYIFSNPIEYTKTLLRFLWNYISPENSAGYISFLAYMGGTGAHTVAYASLWAATAIDFAGDESKSKNRRIRLFTITVLFFTLCTTASALYITFTPVRESGINGYQPRYLLPLMFPFYGIFTCSKASVTVRSKPYQLLSAVSAWVLAATIWKVVVNYIVP